MPRSYSTGLSVIFRSVFCILILQVLSDFALSQEDYILNPVKQVTQVSSKSHAELLTEDATLRDIACIGLQQIWVAGDHNAIWYSNNKGENFKLIKSDKFAHWRHISVLTKDELWIAGYKFDAAYTKPRCCIIHSSDQGKSWDELPSCNSSSIPIYFEVISPEEIYLVTTAFGDEHARYMRYDGAKWNVLAYLGREPWRTAHFFTPETGILAGREGRYLQIVDSQPHPEGVKKLGKSSFNQMCATELGQAILISDQSGIMQSANGGKSWNPLLEDRPPNHSYHDLKTVVAAGNKLLWAAGSPGTMIMKSEDGGKNWSSSVSGVSSTIQKLQFQDEKYGFAVGDFGVILRTTDGGLSWNIIKGEHRQTALLTFSNLIEQVPVNVLFKKARDEGFRCSIHTLLNHDLKTFNKYHDEDLRLEIAAVEAGCNANSLDAALILDRPEFDQQARELFARWGELLDQRDKTILNRLVCRIRQERPCAVLIQKPVAGEENSINFLINKILIQAIHEAANPDYADDSLLNDDLLPWKVKYVYELLPPGHAGTITISEMDYLPHESTYTGVISKPVTQLLNLGNQKLQQILACDLKDSESGNNLGINDLLPGYSISPGSPMRRNVELLTIDLQTQQKTDRINQTLALSKNFAADPEKSVQLLSNIDSSVRQMSEQEAALYLESVIDDYLSTGQVEFALQMCREVIKRYPHSGSAKRSSQRYFQLSGCAEVSYIRLKDQPQIHKIQQVKHEEISTLAPDKKAQEQEIQLLIKNNIPENIPPGPMRNLMEKKIRDAYLQDQQLQQAQKLPTETTTADLINTSKIDEAELQQRYQEVLDFALKMKKDDPEIFQSADIQFPLSRILYKTGKDDLSHELLQKMSREFPESWKAAIQTEIWHYYPAAQPAHELLYLPRFSEKPYLDGNLDDKLWENALKLPMALSAPDELGDRKTSELTTCKAFYDGKFLYFSATCNWHHAPPENLETSADRQHDFNLDGMERILISLDTDRDYFTAYQFEIGAQGQTRESCAGLSSWNPKWYVANKADQQGWTFEAAIPLAELTPDSRLTGNTWNLQFMRIIPGKPLEAIAQPANLPVDFKNCSLLKFK